MNDHPSLPNEDRLPRGGRPKFNLFGLVLLFLSIDRVINAWGGPPIFIVMWGLIVAFALWSVALPNEDRLSRGDRPEFDLFGLVLMFMSIDRVIDAWAGHLSLLSCGG